MLLSIQADLIDSKGRIYEILCRLSVGAIPKIFLLSDVRAEFM